MLAKIQGPLVLAILGVLAAFHSTPANAAACSTNTLQFYLNNYGGDVYANNCTIGTYEFTGFIVGADGYGINNSGGLVTNAWGPQGTNGGSPDIAANFSQFADITITPLADLNGTGFEISDTDAAGLDPISTGSGSITDLGFAFAVYNPSQAITKVYTDLNGTGTVNLNEQFCSETSAPSTPDAYVPPSCSETIISALSGTNTAGGYTFAANTDFVDAGKDIGVGGAAAGPSTLNYVKDQFGPAVVTNVPEPSTIVLFGSALVAFGALVGRRRKRA